MSHEPNPATDSTPDLDTQAWTDSDGTKWDTRTGCPVTWPRLRKLRKKVAIAKQHIKIPGRIRAKKVPLTRRSSSNPLKTQPTNPWVYHREDALEHAEAPDILQAYLDADRQLATNGEYKGKWFLSPRIVAEKLGVHHSLISTYRKNGIPWMPRVAIGCKRGQKRKPITEPFKNGHYGRIFQYWLESDVDEFAKAREDMPEEAPSGFVTVQEAAKNGDISVGYGAIKRKAKTLGFIDVPLKRREKVDGKREFVFTSRHRLLSEADLNSRRAAHSNNPVPANRITVRQLAEIFKVTETEVLRWISHGSRELGGGKLSAVWATLLCSYRDKKGRLRSQLREGWQADKKAAKRIWTCRYPGKPWPLDEPNAGSDATNGEENTSKHATETPAAAPSTEPAPRRTRGRKPGWRDPAVAERKRKLLEAWNRGDFGTNKAAAGRAFSFNRPDASKIINEYEEQKA